MQTFADTQEGQWTDAQNAAIYTTDRSIAVVAGAGSGKTTVLVGRCLHIASDDWSELDRLMAITFTDKAAGELVARLRVRMPAQMRHRIQGAWIGTFHSCMARMLRQYAPLVGLDPSFGILDENASRLLASQVAKNALLAMLEGGFAPAAEFVDAVDFKTAVGAFEDMLAFRWHAQKALSAHQDEDSDDERVLRPLRIVWQRLTDELNLQFERLRSLDFQELEIRSIRLLDENPDVLRAYRKKFRHILLDEFQDTNDLQTEFIGRLFSPADNRLCIVGDPRQSIYRFRGANPTCFANMLRRIREGRGESIDLRDNFRSVPKIVDFVNSYQGSQVGSLFGSLIAGGIAAECEGMVARVKAAEGSGITVILPNSPKEDTSEARRLNEAQAASQFVREMIARKNRRLGDIALLFQALTSIAPYEVALRRAGIPFIVYGGRGLLERQEIKDLISALSYASNPMDGVAMLGVLRSPFIGLSDDDLTCLAGTDPTKFMENVKRDGRCSLLQRLEGMAVHMTPSGILKRIVAETGYEEICSRLDSSGGMTANIERLIEIASSIERQEPLSIQDFTAFIRELKDRSARLGDPPASGDTSNAVKIMSVHAAKGLEFPTVILGDLFRRPPPPSGAWQFTREDGISFKLKDRDHPFSERVETERFKALRAGEKEKQDAESKRLLYVAMTRAKEDLVLIMHPSIEAKGTWHEALMPIAGPIIDDKSVAVWRPSDDDSETPIRQDARSKRTMPEKSPRIDIKPTAFTVSEIECFYRCPEEYRLRYILGLPSDDLNLERKGEIAADVFGSIMHGVMEKYRGGDSIEALVRMSCIKNHVTPDAAIVRRAAGILNSFRWACLSSKIGEGLHELEFEWNCRGHAITGSIDWLIKDEGGMNIVDFKTDHIKAGEEAARAAEYELQLACYTLAAESALKAPVSSTSLVFLMTGTVFEQPTTKGRRESAEKEIARIIDSIRSHRYEARGRTARCLRCPYKRNGLCSIAD